jgi:hypothetical protein
MDLVLHRLPFEPERRRRPISDPVSLKKEGKWCANVRQAVGRSARDGGVSVSTAFRRGGRVRTGSEARRGGKEGAQDAAHRAGAGWARAVEGGKTSPEAPPGFEPGMADLQSPSGPAAISPIIESCDRLALRLINARPITDPVLSQLLRCWDDLPGPVRTAIAALISTAKTPQPAPHTTGRDTVLFPGGPGIMQTFVHYHSSHKGRDSACSSRPGRCHCPSRRAQDAKVVRAKPGEADPRGHRGSKAKPRVRNTKLLERQRITRKRIVRSRNPAPSRSRNPPHDGSRKECEADRRTSGLQTCAILGDKISEPGAVRCCA